ncbi:MAG: hypothetical protein JXR91_01610 [Deltaproteobacteria bacterium]|nr:hypothetical protein [Deltaproteobacteria bacterium]
MKNYFGLLLILSLFTWASCTSGSSDSNYVSPPGGDTDTDTDSDSDSDSDSDVDQTANIDAGADLSQLSMIDTLEDGDGSIMHRGGRWGAWYTFSDESAGSTLNPSGDFVPGNSGHDSGFAAALSGSGFSDWGAGMGFDLSNAGDSTCPEAPSSGRNAYDLSKFDGITFWAKGSHSIRVVIATKETLATEDEGTCASDCDNHYGRTIKLNSEWTQYAFKFSNLSQDEGWGTEVNFNLANAVAVMFMTDANVTVDFAVDDIAFFGATDADPTLGNGTTEGAEDFNIAAGFRASSYGLAEKGITYNDYSYLGGVGTTMSNYFTDGRPSALWIVGEIDTNENPGTCMLNFPNDSSFIENAIFQECDENEAALTHFDSLGYKLWIQVEPGMADVGKLIDAILDRYSHHPCVAGFAVDAEWYSTTSEDGGTEVSDADASSWLSKIKSYNPKYSLVLKHWLSNYMPSPMDGIIYVSDSQNVSDYATLKSNFQQWSYDMGTADIGYQVGYDKDKFWWDTLTNPPEYIGTDLKNTFGERMKAYFWVDFTITDAFPK